MQELSMTVLDIAENSVRAGASLVQITLTQNTAASLQTLIIKDDGKGMSAEMVKTVCDPFTTTRTTRKVGLGLPFLKMAAEQTGGSLCVQSTLGVGTTVTATFTLGHIDLMPLGDIGGSISALCQSHTETDFIFTFSRNGNVFTFDTRQAKELLDGVSLSEPAVAVFIRQHVSGNVADVLNTQ